MPQTLQRPIPDKISCDFSISRECSLAWKFLSDLDRYYPCFEHWFFKKVRLDIATGKRKILLKKSNDKVIAVAILKKYAEENKICTFRVAEGARRNGVGTELMRESLDWLQSNNPIITVNEENAPEFEGFLTKFDFNKTAILDSLYRPNKREIIYNAPIQGSTIKLQ